MTQLVEPITIIAASFCIQSPFLKSDDFGTLEKRDVVLSNDGDPFSLFKLFIEWLKVKDVDEAGAKKWCRKLMVEEQRLYEMVKLLSQFQGVLSSLNQEYEEDDFEIGQKRLQKLVCNFLNNY
jgi:hypothetical protein